MVWQPLMAGLAFSRGKFYKWWLFDRIVMLINSSILRCRYRCFTQGRKLFSDNKLTPYVLHVYWAWNAVRHTDANMYVFFSIITEWPWQVYLLKAHWNNNNLLPCLILILKMSPYILKVASKFRNNFYENNERHITSILKHFCCNNINEKYSQCV